METIINCFDFSKALTSLLKSYRRIKANAFYLPTFSSKHDLREAIQISCAQKLISPLARWVYRISQKKIPTCVGGKNVKFAIQYREWCVTLDCFTNSRNLACFDYFFDNLKLVGCWMKQIFWMGPLHKRLPKHLHSMFMCLRNERTKNVHVSFQIGHELITHLNLIWAHGAHIMEEIILSRWLPC